MAKKIKLLVSPGCSRCEETKRILDKNRLKYTVIDITKSPKLFAKYLMVIPGIIIDGKLEFSCAVPNEKALLKKLDKKYFEDI